MAVLLNGSVVTGKLTAMEMLGSDRTRLMITVGADEARSMGRLLCQEIGLGALGEMAEMTMASVFKEFFEIFLQLEESHRLCTGPDEALERQGRTLERLGMELRLYGLALDQGPSVVRRIRLIEEALRRLRGEEAA